MYIVTEHQYQQLRNCCKGVSTILDEIRRQPLEEKLEEKEFQYKEEFNNWLLNVFS
jgi:hypothetical protein